MPKKKHKYEVYAYDKDADTEVFLAGHGDYESALQDAELMWRPLARDEHIRNLNGKLSRSVGEPFDWLLVRGPDSDTVVPLVPR